MFFLVILLLVAAVLFFWLHSSHDARLTALEDKGESAWHEVSSYIDGKADQLRDELRPTQPVAATVPPSVTPDSPKTAHNL